MANTSARTDQSGRNLLPRRTVLTASALGALGLLSGCAGSQAPAPGSGSSATTTPPPSPASASPTQVSAAPSPTTSSPTPTSASAAEMAARATVPVLCYHQVRPWEASDSQYNRSTLICPPDRFAAQLDGIAGAGFTTISPAQYLAHLTTGAPLPPKPVMLTFDGGKDNQALTALPELARRGMTGTLFIMTVVLDKKGWISSKQVRALADSGMTIGSHTWDHQLLPKLPDTDWAAQLEKPRETLRRLSGQEVEAFAYPYGGWAPNVLPHIAAAGYTTAYQLTDKPLDAAQPLLTLRRQLAVSTWTGAQVVERLTRIAATPGG